MTNKWKKNTPEKKNTIPAKNNIKTNSKTVKNTKIIPKKDTKVINKNTKKEKKGIKGIIKTILIVGFIGVILMLIVGVLFLGYIVKNAPEVTEDKLYNKDASVIFAADGTEMAKIGTEIRQKVSYDEMSQSLIDAIIATEDSRFFQHTGVDLPRFLKASFNQVLGKGGGGASTITMQLSKLAFTSTEDEGIKGIIRKFTDIYVSVFKIETNYTKEEILEFYLNRNYLGGGARGVELASLNYFNKNASELNVSEAAMIAGLFQAPVAYDPANSIEKCEARRLEVLYLMLRHGYINQDEYDIAKELTVEKILVKKEKNDDAEKYQAFIDTVVDEVIEKTGKNPYSVPMHIYTTMDINLQDKMNAVMDDEKTYKWHDDKVQAGSVVLDVKTGKIVAVGAGRDHVVRGDNYATNIKRQIGSTAKPLYDYGPALEYYNWSTFTPIADEKYAYSNGITIGNFDGTYKYFTTLQESLKLSRNIPALKTFQNIDNSKIKEFVTNLHLSPEVDESGRLHEAHSIGGYNGESPLTLAAAYAAFANGGYYNEPYSFTRIEFVDSDEVYENKTTTTKAMSAETAYMMAKMLENTSSYAVGALKYNYAAKTGTTNLSEATQKAWKLPSSAISDKWIASFNDTYAITLWYGYKQLDSEFYLTKSDYNIKDVFKAIAKNVYTKKSTWTKPKGVVEAVVEDELTTALLATENTPDDLKVTAYFKKGFEPTETSTRFATLDNATNVNYDTITNTLSWTAIKPSDYLDKDYLTNMYKSLFSDNSSLNKQVESMLEYNNKNIGTIIYDIYTKDVNGNLTLITSTAETSYIYPIIETTTFVVKTNYTILKTTESSGAEFTVTKTHIPVILASLNTPNNIELMLNSVYSEPAKPVTVLEDGINDVTANSTITVTIKNSATNQIVTSINTSVAGSYTVTYSISYNDFNDTLTKIIVVK